jgi:D-glycero-D-manno-heptose 1,7-bisphosphate phosphatase
MVISINKSKRKAVFLDRDGVLNRAEVQNGKPYAPRSIESFDILPEALPATEALHKAGLLLIVVTNQPDVGNGVASQHVIEEMHERLRKLLPIDDIKTCFHSQKDNCLCRKPQPGMLLDASKDWNIDLTKSFMVGDRWNDVVAGRSQGCFTIFIDRGYSESLKEEPDMTVSSLAEAARLILMRIKNHECQGSI